MLSWLSLHLVHASSGSPHFAAQHPVIRVQTYSARFEPAVLIEIVGNLLVLLINFCDGDMQDVIYLIDWKAGEITMVSLGPTSSFSATYTEFSK
jgi:hypothetical protein